MNYRNHLIFGTVTSIATPIIMNQAGFSLDMGDIAVIIPAVIAGSLFPDCDTASIPSRIYAILGVIWSVFFFIFEMNDFIIPLWLPFIFAKMSRHRSWTHARWLPVVLTAIPFFLFRLTINYPRFHHIADLMYEYRLLFMAFSLGLITHLILDTSWFRKFAIAIGIHK